MTDPLIRRLPPMANEWTLGLASGRALDADGVARFSEALTAADSRELRELLPIVVTAIETANSNFFRFDIETAVDEFEPTSVRLTATRDTRTAGLGIMRDQSTRKLVALVVLHVQGDEVQLVLDGHEKSTDASVGSIVLFPAYCNVRVEGPEGSAVEVAACHAFGPAFR